MIKELQQIDTTTDEGKLAICLLARLTTMYDTALTPDMVIEKANKLSPFLPDKEANPKQEKTFEYDEDDKTDPC